VLLALTRARDVPDLLARWHRLETFSHGRHRIRVEHAGSCEVRMTHGARDGGPEPSEPETTLVLSVLARLAEIVQAAPLALVDPAGRPWRKDGMWHDPGRVREVPPAVNPVNEMVADLRKRIEADPIRRWSLAEISGDVGLSSRSLQRRLAQQGLSLSRLVRETRLQAAAALLVEATGPGLAEIGYLAGYADQAHFTRSFAKGVGTSPRRYREAFSNSSPSHSCS
jgi:AraC-like DNA-binding protein